MLPGGRGRPPDSAATGFPGARYRAAKITKLAMNRLTMRMASLRAKTASASAQPARPRLFAQDEYRYADEEIAPHAAVTATMIRRFDFLLIRPPRRSRSPVGKALW